MICNVPYLLLKEDSVPHRYTCSNNTLWNIAAHETIVIRECDNFFRLRTDYGAISEDDFNCTFFHFADGSV
jgi:hypothetical protein